MVSSIYTAKKSAVLKDMWEIASILYPSIAMSANILFLGQLINDYLNNKFLETLTINFLQNAQNNVILNVVFLLLIPLYIINFLLIIYKKKYLTILKQYPKHYNKMIASFYIVISIVVPIIYLLAKFPIRWNG